ncbi:MAG: MFS transporter [Micropruina sp.]|uniref:MFS transporter n=1 Tax=Micropruina sp. TaxID=2737536 RepID=UPI0039E4D57B
MADTTQDKHSRDQAKKAAASGWIGSALEYYDFFIYAQAAALIFPTIMFDQADPRMGIIGALGTYAVGYVARPIGAVVLGAWGDKYGRKNVLVLCMMLMGISTMLVAFLPTYQQIGFGAPVLLLALRLIQGFAVAGEVSGASSMITESAAFGRRGYFGSFTLQGTQAGQLLAAFIFLPLAHFLSEDAFQSWGWRIPFALSALVVIAGYLIRRNVDETHTNAEEQAHGEVAALPLVTAFKESPGAIFRVFCMALTSVIATTTSVFGAAYATSKSYGIGFTADVYLWIPILSNILAVILTPLLGNLSDRIGRRPMIVIPTILAGLMSYAYLWAISQHNVGLAIVFSLVMWGCLFQGYQATFPSFFPELFPAHTRVSGMAFGQNMGTVVASLMSVVFPLVAPPGSTNVVLIVGSLTFGICLIASAAAYFSPETFRMRLEDLGAPGAKPVPEVEYNALRAASIAAAKKS